MKLYYTGILKVKNANEADIEKILDAYIGHKCWYYDNGEIEFDGSWPFGDGWIESLVEAFEKAGMLATGTLNYTGEEEGRTKILENQITELSMEDAVVEDASDKTLSDELTSRGYTVYKESSASSPNRGFRKEVETPMGNIIAESVLWDPEHPGINILIRKTDETQEDTICTIEYHSAEYNKDCFQNERESITLYVYAPDINPKFVSKEEPEEPFMYFEAVRETGRES